MHNIINTSFKFPFHLIPFTSSNKNLSILFIKHPFLVSCKLDIVHVFLSGVFRYFQQSHRFVKYAYIQGIFILQNH